MPECWFAKLPGAGPCDGSLRVCHLIPQNKLALEFPRGAVRTNGEMEWRPLGKSGDLRDEAVSGQFMPLAGLQGDPRCWVPGCGGPMGNAGHHGRFQPDGPRRIPRALLPAELLEFAEELGLSWWIDRTYPPSHKLTDHDTSTVDGAAASARTAHRNPLTGLYL